MSGPFILAKLIQIYDGGTWKTKYHHRLIIVLKEHMPFRRPLFDDLVSNINFLTLSTKYQSCNKLYTVSDISFPVLEDREGTSNCFFTFKPKAITGSLINFFFVYYIKQ